MYKLYVDHCILFNERVSSKSFFGEVSHKNFNLLFLNKAKSECDRCVGHISKVDSETAESQIEEGNAIHVNIAKQIKSEFVESVQQISNDTKVYTFQLF